MLSNEFLSTTDTNNGLFFFLLLKFITKSCKQKINLKKTHKNIKVPSTSGDEIKIMFCLKAG